MKYTNEERDAAIREDFNSGMTHKALSIQYNLREAIISQIVSDNRIPPPSRIIYGISQAAERALEANWGKYRAMCRAEC